MHDVPWYAYWWPSNDDAAVFGHAGVAASSMGNMVLSASLASDAVEAALAAKIRAMEEKVVMLEENRSRTEMVCMSSHVLYLRPTHTREFTSFFIKI